MKRNRVWVVEVKNEDGTWSACLAADGVGLSRPSLHRRPGAKESEEQMIKLRCDVCGDTCAFVENRKGSQCFSRSCPGNYRAVDAPVNPEVDAAYWRARAEKAEADAERLRAVEKAAKAMVEYADRCNDDSTELENLRGAFSGRGPEGKVKT